MQEIQSNIQYYNDFFNSMSVKELTDIKKILINVFNKKVIDEIEEDKYPDCPKCMYYIVIKKGFTTNKTQRFQCTKCKKTYIKNTNKILHYSKKMKYKLIDFIKYEFDGLSLRSISKKLSISLKTAFQWRTKLNQIYSKLYKNTLFKGTFYADQKLFRINLKGTKPQNMPRESKKTSHSVKSRKELVLVETAIDNNNLLAEVIGVCKPKSKDLLNLYKDKVISNITMVTDGERSYKETVYELSLHREKVINGYNKKRFNLNKINNFHSHMELEFSKKRGISTRHLQGYMNYFKVKWLYDLHKYIDFDKLIELMKNVLKENTSLRATGVNKIKYTININKIYEKLIEEGKYSKNVNFKHTLG